MANVTNVPMTRAEAWAVLEALAQMNHGETDGIEVQRRSWIAERILRLFPAPEPAPAPEPIGKMSVGRFLDLVLPTLEGYDVDGNLEQERR